jgi:hypothetical protein
VIEPASPPATDSMDPESSVAASPPNEDAGSPPPPTSSMDVSSTLDQHSHSSDNDDAAEGAPQESTEPSS